MATDDPKLDETIEESFPASDPPANTVETGIVPEGVPPAGEITDNVAEHRLELTMGARRAFLVYERTPTSFGPFSILYTDTPTEPRLTHATDSVSPWRMPVPT